MKRFFVFPALLPAVLLAANPAVAATTRIRVTANRVNLRSGPSQGTKAVSQVSKGDILLAGKLNGDWVEVAPPAGVNLWVYSELVRDGVVAVSRLQVRAGAGISYKAVGKLKKGERVKVRGKKGDWLKIAPPAGCTLWISRKYVEPVAVPGKKPKPRPAPPKGGSLRVPPRGAGKPVRKSPKPAILPPKPAVSPHVPDTRNAGAGSARLPAALSAARLVSSKQQGKRVEYAGVLRPSGLVWRRPSNYRLVKYDKRGRAVTKCYVLGNESRFVQVMGRSVLIRGREYWVQGVRCSVVAADRIVRKD